MPALLVGPHTGYRKVADTEVNRAQNEQADDDAKRVDHDSPARTFFRMAFVDA